MSESSNLTDNATRARRLAACGYDTLTRDRLNAAAEEYDRLASLCTDAVPGDRPFSP